MTDRDEEIRKLRRQVRDELVSLEDRLDEQLAEQELQCYRAALEAIKANDIETALNKLVEARLVEQVREVA